MQARTSKRDAPRPIAGRTIANELRKLRGLQAWDVRVRTLCIDFHFGTPVLLGLGVDRRVPIERAWRAGGPRTYRTHAAGSRRLCVFHGHWSLRFNGKELASKESSCKLKRRAGRLLSGVRIREAIVSPSPRELILRFDDGLELHTRPYRFKDADMWFFDFSARTSSSSRSVSISTRMRIDRGGAPRAIGKVLTEFVAVSFRLPRLPPYR